MQKFTDIQRYQFIDHHMSGPVALRDLDTSQPFVYDREYGAFYVSMGRHPGAMSLLLAFHHGQRDGIDVADMLGLEYSSETADAWLRNIPGTAFKSSVGSGRIQAGKVGSLSAGEIRVLGDIEYIF
jgi:hypothetical protein